MRRMLLRLPSFVSRYSSFPLSICGFRPRNMCAAKIKDDGVGQQISLERKQATHRICSVSSHMIELLELRAEDPSFHVLFIPGNPGVVSYYKEFFEALYELLGETASITAIGHISQTRKMDFIKQEICHTEVPLLLVGHSIGSYISVEIFKRLPEQVKYCIGLYPFLTLDKNSFKQSVIGKISASQPLSVILSSIVAVLGFLPNWVTRALVRRLLGSTWSSTAVEATCTHLLQYHCVRNALFMAMTEFIKLSEVPDWKFIRGKQDKIAFLFGIDDHWGPLTLFEEISKQAPDVALSIERGGHTHTFSCTEAGSIWVAEHVASLINHQCQDISGSRQEMLKDLNA